MVPRCPICGRTEYVVFDGMGGHYCNNCAYSFKELIFNIIDSLL